MRLRRTRKRGQALVEFAFTFPLFMVIVFTIIQLGLLFAWYFSTTQVTRESARWLAVHSDSTDLEAAQYIRNNLLPGMVGGASSPSIISGNSTSASSSGSTPTVATFGAVTAKYTPCIPRTSPDTGCSHPDRVGGETLFVELTYNAEHIIFFPSKIQLGNFSAYIPTSLPTYRVWVMVE